MSQDVETIFILGPSGPIAFLAGGWLVVVVEQVRAFYKNIFHYGSI